jgi:hypothetical protein
MRWQLWDMQGLRRDMPTAFAKVMPALNFNRGPFPFVILFSPGDPFFDGPFLGTGRGPAATATYRAVTHSSAALPLRAGGHV